jgi:hypothetical protein
VFSCEQEKYKENDKSAQKVYFGSSCTFREFWKSTVIFSGQNDIGHYLESGLRTLYEDFEKRFLIPINFISEQPQMAAQPPLAVAKNKFTLPFISPI